MGQTPLLVFRCLARTRDTLGISIFAWFRSVTARQTFGINRA